MKIYISHSGTADYEAELYEPLQKSPMFREHTFFLPHNSTNVDVKTRDIIADYDICIAEVSQPSTGQGIELGLASAAGVPIACFFKTGATPSGSLRFYAQTMTQYADTNELLSGIAAIIAKRS